MTSEEPEEIDGSRPVVRMPPQGLPGGVIAALAIVVALILFVTLDAQRRRRASVRTAPSGATFTAPPPLAVPPDVKSPLVTYQPPAAAIVTTMLSRPPKVVTSSQPSSPVSAPVIVAVPQVATTQVSPSAQEEQPSRLTAPALVVDTAAGVNGIAASAAPTATSASGATGSTNGQEEMPARAAVIRNQSNTVPIGTLIPIVLETPIDTARPGLVRAVASGDTRGFDGRRILIPRGSRLIGEYQADVRPGQNRVLVSWTRLVRPDGVTMRLGSPAADELGGAGVPGRVNTFFFRRFASAILQSALTVGVNIASRPRAGSVVVGLPTSPLTNLGQNLLPGNDLRPKITVKQGAILNVFVARDLDFSGSGARRP